MQQLPLHGGPLEAGGEVEELTEVLRPLLEVGTDGELSGSRGLVLQLFHHPGQQQLRDGEKRLRTILVVAVLQQVEAVGSTDELIGGIEPQAEGLSPL